MNVGCPIYNRGWILKKWLSAVKVNLGPDRYFFVYTPSDDDTLRILRKWAKSHEVHVIYHREGVHGTARDWANRERIETLAVMRNKLLDVAAETGQAFMSLDSDVILRGAGFTQHVAIDSCDIVGPTVSLATDRTIINAFSHRRPDGYIVRAKPGHHGKVDVLCAAKYMTSRVVENVRYGYHPRGEDFFFAQQAREKGYSMGLCTEVAEHWMTQGRDPIVADFVPEYRKLHG